MSETDRRRDRSDAAAIFFWLGLAAALRAFHILTIVKLWKDQPPSQLSRPLLRNTD
jgi:hypothetical protein